MDPETDFETVSEEIAEAPPTDESFATLSLDLGCTATALTDHWVMTAAHCLDGHQNGDSVQVCSAVNCQNPPAADILYDGAADYYPHPDFSMGFTGADNDIALIRLRGAGMRDAPRIKVYADDRTPWFDPSLIEPSYQVDPDQRFTAIGYGWGSNVGSGNECNGDGTNLNMSAIKRISEDIELQAHNIAYNRVSTINGAGGLCRGDSGGPWLLERGGELLQFAVQSWIQYEFLHINSRAVAELVPNKWGWIEATAEAAGLPLRCEIYRAGGYRYRMCEDDPVFIGLEAEQGQLAGPYTVADDDFASAGGSFALDDDTTGWVNTRYTVNVPRAGYYAVWVRTQADYDGSLPWLQLGSAVMTWPVPVSSEWRWDLIRVSKLAAGDHPLVVYSNEPGLRIDRLLITSMSAAVWRPSEQWLEAEDFALTYPMKESIAATLGFARYIEVPNSTLSSGGAAAWTLAIQPPGDYHMWGLVRSPSDYDNSFWLTVDSGQTLLWDTPVTPPGTFVWDRFSDRSQGDALYHLSGGWRDLVIERRETGAGLDKVLVTNDLGFVPVWHAPGNTLPGDGGFGF